MGLAKVKQKPSIAKVDLRKLYDCTEDPKGLQNEVWFEIMLFFCRRGRENLRELQKDRFSFGEASSGRIYLCKIKDELTKIRHEGSEVQEGGLVFELRGNPKCPVQSFEKYLSKLNPDCQYLFQRLKTEPKDSIWYDKQYIGKATHGAKMKEIPLHAKLSKIYINHFV